MPSSTPACVIENGTMKTQRQLLGTLRTLCEDVAGASLSSPAIIVIGDVVRLAHVAEEKRAKAA
jgi:uroporphyrin-III C-methyltransferase/precorrin-2 dehydrogenase/sirohydrochlorin ferrochelatase